MSLAHELIDATMVQAELQNDRRAWETWWLFADAEGAGPIDRELTAAQEQIRREIMESPTLHAAILIWRTVFVRVTEMSCVRCRVQLSVTTEAYVDAMLQSNAPHPCILVYRGVR